MEALEEILDPEALDSELTLVGKVTATIDEQLSQEAIEITVVKTFQETALETAAKFKDWVLERLKSTTLTDIVVVGTGIFMLYQMIAKQAETAQSSGQRVKLASAIDGCQATLVEKYTDTIQ